MSLCAHACHGEQMSRAPLSLGRIPGVAESCDARRFKMVDGGLRDLTMQAWMSAICLKWCSHFSLCVLQLQPLTPLVDEFASRLFGELDYVQEGLSAEKFQVGAVC